MSWVAAAAASLGASEAALRLILGQLAGYPLVLLYRRLLAHRDTNTQHTFFFLSGLLVGQWVVGPDVLHSLYAVLATYLVLLCAAGTLTSVIVSFVFNLGYLLIGYLYTESEGYDICWTMPHCVLTLKLIGLTFDCYDGARAARLGDGVLSKDQKQTHLLEPPGLLEMLSHSFFIGGYFVGPLIPLRRYRQFVRPSYTAALPASPLPYALKRLLLGLAYMLLHVLGSGLLPAAWPASQAFADTPLLLRLLLLPLWVKIILAKYLFVWLFAEGVCVLSGLSFVERRPDGSVDWRGCANVKVGRFESATCFANIIEAFNINTNQWVAAYVYKRLKFLGNRVVSQVLTLAFLAVWHGFHVGYYITFLNEFLTVQVNKRCRCMR
jgi:lysophospholipid acyltransferase 5